jgi:hypothetical protein
MMSPYFLPDFGFSRSRKTKVIMEVMQMRECKLCGKDAPELLGPYCGRCDKIVGDINIDVVAELEPRELVV